MRELYTVYAVHVDLFFGSEGQYPIKGNLATFPVGLNFTRQESKLIRKFTKKSVMKTIVFNKKLLMLFIQLFIPHHSDVGNCISKISVELITNCTNEINKKDSPAPVVTR